MKKHLFLAPVMLITMSLITFVSCQKSENEDQGILESKSIIEQAKLAYLDAVSKTTQHSHECEDESCHDHGSNILIPDDITPLWDDAAITKSSGNTSIAVPFTAGHKVKGLHLDAYDSLNPNYMDMCQELLITETPEGWQFGVRSFLPTNEYYSQNQDYASSLTKSAGKSAFDGVALVHDLDGEFVSVLQYENGIVSKTIKAGDEDYVAQTLDLVGPVSFILYSAGEEFATKADVDPRACSVCGKVDCWGPVFGHTFCNLCRRYECGVRHQPSYGCPTCGSLNCDRPEHGGGPQPILCPECFRYDCTRIGWCKEDNYICNVCGKACDRPGSCDRDW